MCLCGTLVRSCIKANGSSVRFEGLKESDHKAAVDTFAQVNPPVSPGLSGCVRARVCVSNRPLYSASVEPGRLSFGFAGLTHSGMVHRRASASILHRSSGAQKVREYSSGRPAPHSCRTQLSAQPSSP